MEVWKKIKDYPNYEISNLGNVKSLYFDKEKYLKGTKNSTGYLTVKLWSNKIPKTKNIHQLVTESFLNHTPCGYKLVVNHIDFNKLNNRLDNLEIVTQRENSNKKHINSSSKYVGVCWSKLYNRWKSTITISNKRFELGYFESEKKASKAYTKALNIFELGVAKARLN